jgi:ribonuclease Z
LLQAYRTILTHFSQRYPRMPEGLDDGAVPLRDRPAVAFDGMVVPFSLLPVLPLVVPVMTQVCC